jgi:lysophospholipase L1-like esterase
MLLTNTQLLMTGDSITDCGRERPIGRGAIEKLGGGYVALTQARLIVEHPELKVDVINTGISGDTVRDLAKRWEADVIAPRPDIVSVMIGVNDVWRKFGAPEDHVPLAEYEETLGRLVDGARPAVKEILLLTPFLIETNPEDEFLQLVREYGAAVKRIAASTNSGLIDTQMRFEHLLTHYHGEALASDRVHPTLTGHDSA